MGRDFAAFGSADPEWGMALNIATNSQISDSVIQSMLSENFSIKARTIHRISAIPRTALDKVDRIALGKLLP